MRRVYRKHSRLFLAKRIIREVRSHPANLESPSKSLLRAVAWQVHKRFARQRVTVHAYGFELRFPKTSGSLSNLLYFGECFAWEAVNFVRAFARAGDTIVDAGANVGMFTYMALEAVGPSGQVVAFEPISENAAITENISRNGRSSSARVYTLAPSDSAGVARFTDDSDVSNRITLQDVPTGRSSREVAPARLTPFSIVMWHC